MIRSRLAVVAAVAALGTPMPAHAAAAADSPFVGTWKLNPARSQLAGGTLQFAARRGGKIRCLAAGHSYTFRPDGKDYESAMRLKVAWTRVDDRTWRAVWKLKKKPIATETLAIAADGRTMQETTQGIRADGSPFEDSALYERIAGTGTSLVGTWRSTKVALGGLQTLAIESRPHGHIVLTMVESRNSCTARLDGEDYAFRGPTAPPGLTFSFRPTGERALHVIQKQDGVPLYAGAITVDADGHTLTWDWRPTTVDEPMKVVFERQ